MPTNLDFGSLGHLKNKQILQFLTEVSGLYGWHHSNTQEVVARILERMKPYNQLGDRPHLDQKGPANTTSGVDGDLGNSAFAGVDVNDPERDSNDGCFD